MRGLPAALLVAALLAGTLTAQGSPPPPEPPQQPGAPAADAAVTAGQQSPEEAAARAAEARGDMARAGELWLALAKRDPQRADWALAAGRCLGLAGSHNDALDLLDEARRRFPEDLDLTVLLARTYTLKAEHMLARGVRDLGVTMNFQEARRLAEDVLRRAPDHREARLILAQVLWSLGDLDRAEAQAQIATQKFADHPGGFLVLGNVAFARYVELRRRQIDEQPAGKELSDLLEQAGAARRAATDAFEAAIKLDSTRALPHKMLGDIHAWNNNLGQARASYERALALDPDCGVNHSWLAQHLNTDQRLALYRDAAAAYRARPGADPRRAALLDWYTAHALYDKKEWQQAEALFRKAVEANPAFVNSHYYGMMAAFAQMDTELALGHAAAFAAKDAVAFADLVRSLENQAAVLDSLAMLGRLAMQKGLGHAARDLHGVLAMVRDTADDWNNHALLCRDTGKFEQSLESYRRALLHEPDSPQLLNDVSVILQYHLPTPAHLQEARENYRRAIVLAEKVLADAKASQADKDRARQAKQDARSNLEKLGAKK